MNKIITFYGIERGDFVYYLAVTLMKNGYSVAVMDNSRLKDIFDAVSLFADTDLVIKQDIAYYKNSFMKKSDDSQIDFVLCWQGQNYNKKIIKASDEFFILGDYTPGFLYKLNDSMDEEDKDKITGVILRDYVESCKMNDESIAKISGIDEDKFIGNIAYDEKDYSNYISFAHNGRQRFNNISPNFIRCLEYMVSVLLDVDEATAVAYVKKAKKVK